jgi:hypothetical protein
MNDDEKEALLKVVKDISASMTRVEAERDYIKQESKAICEELNLDAKLFKKIVKTYHKQNVDAERLEFTEFITLYEEVTKP